ncbi:MAG: protein kinase [Candidatus Hydrogenedentes bacterium]|nr:protein kinase [Candidatus Hydrogenedentota bacterium]
MDRLGQLRPGKCLGKYRIIAEIGRGGMGVVYLAEDTALDRKVAIKILPGSMMSDSVFVESLRQEARIAAGLSHPNVVHIHAFEIIEGVPMIEMEYVQGGSLVQRQGQKPMTLSDVARYGHGVSCALLLP